MAQKNIKTKTKKKKGTKTKVKKNLVAKSFWQQKDLLMPLGFVLLVTFIAFIPSLSNGFVNWDDDANFIKNPNLDAFDWQHIKAIFTSTVMGGYNPLSIFTFAIEKALGFSPMGYHINNLLLHLVCVFFVYRIMLMLNISKTGAVIAALLFGIHPMRVESVAWVTERKDVLFGAFYLAAIINYIKYLNSKNKQQKYFVWAIILFVFSLFSKIQAVSLPLSLLAIDYYFKRPINFKLIIEKAPFFILSLLVGGLGVYLLAAEKTIDTDEQLFSFFERLFIGAYSFCVYLFKFIFPYPLSPVYPYPKALTPMMWAAPLGVLAILFMIFRFYKKDDRGIIFGFAFFLFNVMFVLQIVGAGQGFIADRFTYIPYIGLFFIVALLYDRLTGTNLQTKNYFHYGFGAIALLFAGMTWVQCGIWKSGETLWSHVMKHHETSLPYSNRGHYYRDNGKPQLAIADYKKSIQMNPGKAITYNSLGKVLFDSGQTQEAITYLDQAIQLNPNGEAEFYINRGVAYGKLQNYDMALRSFNKGVEIDPTNKNLYFNRSLLFAINQQFDLAVKDHDAYLAIDPSNADVYYERGVAKRMLGQFQNAINDQNKAIQLNPNIGLSYFERSQCYRSMGNKSQALQEAKLAQSKGVQVPTGYLQELQ